PQARASRRAGRRHCANDRSPKGGDAERLRSRERGRRSQCARQRGLVMPRPANTNLHPLDGFFRAVQQQQLSEEPMRNDALMEIALHLAEGERRARIAETALAKCRERWGEAGVRGSEMLAEHEEKRS